MGKVRRGPPNLVRLFRKAYPNAFVDDDHQWVHIRNKKVVTEECPHCNRSWTHMVVDYSQILGSGNCETAAWEDAARNFWYRQRHGQK